MGRPRRGGALAIPHDDDLVAVGMNAADVDRPEWCVRSEPLTEGMQDLVAELLGTAVRLRCPRATDDLPGHVVSDDARHVRLAT
jgi:hypothetical protein